MGEKGDMFEEFNNFITTFNGAFNANRANNKANRTLDLMGACRVALPVYNEVREFNPDDMARLNQLGRDILALVHHGDYENEARWYNNHRIRVLLCYAIFTRFAMRCRELLIIQNVHEEKIEDTVFGALSNLINEGYEL